MDYETKAASRNELRLYAKLFRSICGFNNFTSYYENTSYFFFVSYVFIGGISSMEASG